MQNVNGEQERSHDTFVSVQSRRRATSIGYRGIWEPDYITGLNKVAYFLFCVYALHGRDRYFREFTGIAKTRED